MDGLAVYVKERLLHGTYLMDALTVLGYLPKFKRGLKLAFSAHFLYTFSIQVLINTLSINQAPVSFFSLSRYQTKCVFKFLFSQFMTS